MKLKEEELFRITEKLLKEEVQDIKDIEIAKKTVKQLREIIKYYDWNYYILNKTVISDKEYDNLFLKIKILEEKFPSLVSPDSPTQRVSGGITEKFTQAKHLSPLLSLENSYNADDLIDWDRRVKDLINNIVSKLEYVAEPKYDGASIAIVYEDDLLLRAVTRGDGYKGDDVTNNVKVLRTVPLSVPFSKYDVKTIEIRGEILINKNKLNEINKQRIKEGMTPLANPRNAAAGALHLKDSKEVEKRGLEAFFYHINFAVDKYGNNLIGKVFKNHYKNLEILNNEGFKTPYPTVKVCQDIGEIIEYCKEWDKKRSTFPYEIDGMVIKVNNVELQNKCGYTSHHPRWAIAYKFEAEQVRTILNDVVFQVGRTGIITPVAKVKAAVVGGASISSISLFNEDFIKDKDLRIGDKIIIERAGEVIPYVVRVEKNLRTGKEKQITFPSNCPSCFAPLYREKNEAAWRCVNANCPAQIVEKIIHFVSKDAMEIKGLGENLIRRFFKLGIICKIQDIYQLDYDKLEKLEGFAKKSIENLKKSIEESKHRQLHRFIYALGIRYVGETTAKTIADKINNIEDLYYITQEELEKIRDIGPKVAESITGFFKNPYNIQLINDLKKLGVYCTKERNVINKSLSGKTFLFTGTLHSLTRSKAKELVEKNGGKILSGISKKLDFLVVGDSPGSKLEKAKKISSIKIINEDEFLEIIGEKDIT